MDVSAPGHEGHRIRPAAGKPEVLREKVCPDRICVEYATGNRRIAALRNVLQQGIGQPVVCCQARVKGACPEQVTHHLPAVDPVQPPPGKAGEYIEAELPVVQGRDDNQGRAVSRLRCQGFANL